MTTNNASLLNLEEAAQRRVKVRPYGSGQDLVLEDTLYDGENLVIHVTDNSNETVTLSDSGQVAASLFIRGVDLSKQPAKHAWEHINALLTRGFTAPLSPDHQTDEWELSITAYTQELPSAIRALSAAMLRADGLGTLVSRTAPRLRFATQMAQVTRTSGLEVSENKRIATRSGMARQVHFVAHSGPRDFQVQTVTTEGGNINASVDSTYSILADSKLDPHRRVAVFDREAVKKRALVNHIKEVATVVLRDDLANYWHDQLRAA